jgi:hypothetical protein
VVAGIEEVETSSFVPEAASRGRGGQRCNEADRDVTRLTSPESRRGSRIAGGTCQRDIEAPTRRDRGVGEAPEVVHPIRQSGPFVNGGPYVRAIAQSPN